MSVEAEEVLLVTVWFECGLRALLRRRSEEVRIGVVKPWNRFVRMLSVGRPSRYIVIVKFQKSTPNIVVDNDL